MPQKETRPLTLVQLVELDGLSFSKAGTVLAEAREYLRRYDHDLAVRRSQESFELFLKSLLRYLQSQYPASHDLKDQIYELSAVLRGYDVSAGQIAKLVLANSVLHVWRLPSFYGDERLNVGGIFNEKEASLAISYAELAQFLCNVVRAKVYSQVH